MGDMLSQAEIDALLGGGSTDTGVENDVGAENSKDTISDNAPASESVENLEMPDITDDDSLTGEKLEDYKKIGEDILESASNTLFQILNKPVKIQPPIIQEMLASDVKNIFTEPEIGIIIKYVEGLEGSNVLVLNEDSGKIIVNLMMGGDGEASLEQPISEIDVSAVSETMNQVTGALSTVLFKIIGQKIDIGVPKYLNLEKDKDTFINEIGFEEDKVIIVSNYNIKVGDLLECKMYQIIPKEYALTLIKNFDGDKANKASEITEKINSIDEEKIQDTPQNKSKETNNKTPVQKQSNAEYNAIGGGQMAQEQRPYTGSNYQNINAQPALFQNFEISDIVQQKENISIIMDVPLEVTVEMGRTYKKIEEILEFSPGTIIELEKLAGDPIDILVNGKFVAKGEVVVIDENYGVRITDIINLKNRI